MTPTLEGPRPARLEERAALIDMINLVFRTSVGREPTIGRDWQHVYAPENLHNVSLICDRTPSDMGKIVASTGVWANDVRVGNVTLRVGGINCVGTLADYRRHGLGAKVMAAAHQTMRDLGCHVGLLSTGIVNWYRRMGWEEAGETRAYRINRGNVGLLPQLAGGQRIRVVDLTTALGDGQGRDESFDNLLNACVALSNQQGLGSVRSAQDFRQRLYARQVGHLVVVESDNANGPAAFLLLDEHHIVDWAGAVAEVARLVRACFERVDDRSLSTSQGNDGGRSVAPRQLTLITPGKPHPLVNLLDGVRVPYSRDYLGMVYVVDPKSILAAFGLSAIQVAEKAVDAKAVDGLDSFTLRYQGATLTLDRGQLTKLFFGPERISDFAAGLFPLPLWQWRLEKV